jgi:hypothetical protein
MSGCAHTLAVLGCRFSCAKSDMGLTGEPIDEPVVGHGPFVMNSQTEIRQAVDDYNAGRFGAITL